MQREFGFDGKKKERGFPGTRVDKLMSWRKV